MKRFDKGYIYSCLVTDILATLAILIKEALAVAAEVDQLRGCGQNALGATALNAHGV